MAPSPVPPVDRDRRRRRRRWRWRRPPRVPEPVGGRSEPPARRRTRRLPPPDRRPGPGRPPGDNVSATVATPGNEGVEEFADSGDLTGTADIQDAVYSQGPGVAPQLHY